MLCNINYLRNITYEHPNIEYLNFIAQFYVWVPIVLMFLEYFGADRKLSVMLNMVISVVFIVVGLIKPRIFVNLLE